MEPESESNVENTASLPIIKNSVVLPYQNSEELALFVKSLPQTCVKEFIMAKTKFLALIVQMVTRKAEEKAMGIQEQDIVDYRERFAIPDSDGLEPEERTTVYKRSRSDTTFNCTLTR